MKSCAEEKRVAERLEFEVSYENLRQAALGGPLPPEARSGLALFLRRGMWAWAQAVDAASASRQPNRPSSTPGAPTEHRTLIQVFAAMVLQPANGRIE